LTFYLNFKYGYSYPGVTRDMTEVRERDYFFIVSFSLWGLWSGVGIAALWMWLSDRMSEGADAVRASAARGVSALRPSWRAAPVLVLALIPLFANWSWADRSYDYSARDWAYNLLMSVEPYGILFTNGDNDTFPLWYLQEVEGIRRDVTVMVTSYLNTEWYVQQLAQLTSPCPAGVDPAEDWSVIRCQRPYTFENTSAAYVADAADAPAGVVPLVLDAPVRPPTSSIMPLTPEQIARVASSYVPLEQASVLMLGLVEEI